MFSIIVEDVDSISAQAKGYTYRHIVNIIARYKF